MADEYVPYPLPPCPDPPVEPTPQPCADWSICLPFGGRLIARNGCVYAEGGNPPADGVYGKIIIANGCIAGVEPVEACVDNVALCAGNPETCVGGVPGSTASKDGSINEIGGGSGGSGGCCSPSKTTGNLYALDAAGLPLVRCTIRGGSGISVSGNGTVNSPYVISAAAIDVQSIYLTSENDAIAVRGSGSYANPFALVHKDGKQGKYNGMTFDKYGHLIDTGEGSANSGINAVVGGTGIDVQTDNRVGMATVSLAKPTRNKNGTYHIGGWALELDEYNRIFDLTREINLTSATYPFGIYNVSVNPTGSISRIAQSNNGLGENFVFNWQAGGTPRSRSAIFTLRIPTALGGVLYTAMDDVSFWKNISIMLDSMTAAHPKIETKAPDCMPFWSFGVFAPGQHTLTITSSTAWKNTSDAVVQLFAVSAPDSLSES